MFGPERAPPRNTVAPFTRRQAFWVAVHGFALMEQLARENGAAIAQILGDRAEQAMARYRAHRDILPGAGALSAEDWQRDVVIPFCAAFFEHAYPADKPAQRQLAVMNWIRDRYLNDRHNDRQILLEDIHKIGRRIRYFTKLKNSGRLSPGEAITDYPSLSAIDARLELFEATRNFKIAARNKHHINDAERDRIMRESSVLYDGPAGRIVVVHTVDAARYWGNGTKWCLAGEEEGDIHFTKYNRGSPVLFLLPRGGEKMALVDKKYWDPRDKTHRVPNDAVAGLLDVAIKTIPVQVAKSLRGYMPRDNNEREVKALPPLAKKFAPLPDPEEQAWVDRLILASSTVKETSIPPTISKNKRIFMAAVQQSGTVLAFADETLRKDRDVVLAAVQRCGWALQYADESLQKEHAIVWAAVRKDGDALKFSDESLRKDRRIVLAAVQGNGFSLQYASEALRKDHEVVLAAVRADGRALQLADVSFRQDREVVLAAVRQNGLAIQYADKSFRNDPMIILEAVRQDGFALKYADNRLCKDTEIVLTAVRQDGRALQYADQILRNSPDFARAVLEQGRPEMVLTIRQASDGSEIFPELAALLGDDEVAYHQIRAVETLLMQGRDEVAVKFLRFIQPLWGHGSRIFGDPAEQVAWLRRSSGPDVLQVPCP